MGFQLTQVRLGRKVREQKGAWVRALERFNIVVTKTAASKPAAQLLGTNRFVGSIMQTTMNQKMENWSNSLWRNEQVHRDDQSLLPLLVHSFIACGRTRRPHAPACVKWKEWWWKTLCPGLDTHTHTHLAPRRGGAGQNKEKKE